MSDGSGEATVFQQLGEYRLVEALGESELFRVFKARHDKLQRDVVIKFLRNAHDPHALARFRREMKAIGDIEHPNIVWASDAGEHNGTPYIVMEYLAGQTLQRLIAANGPLPVADACELTRQAAVGLDCIHARRMVHRDVKPSNLLLTDDGVVKLLDFGLIRLAQDSGESDELTAAATALGTPDYIAPEQASDSRSVDFRADIYSLGCTLYEMLTGAPPFAGAGHETTVKKLLAHTRTPAPPVQAIRPDVPPELSELLHRMLAKAPADRPGSVAKIIAFLKPFSSGNRLAALLKAPEHAAGAPRNSSTQSVNMSPTIAWTSDQKQHPAQLAQRRWRIPAVALALIAALIVGWASWLVWHSMQPSANNAGAKTHGASKEKSALAQEQARGDPLESTTDNAPAVIEGKPPQDELSQLREQVDAAAGMSSDVVHAELRERLLAFSRLRFGTPEQIAAAGLMSRLRWPSDMLSRDAISKEELGYTGNQPGNSPPELVAVFGTGRLKHWGPIREIAFSPDGGLLATPGYDGVVCVWDARTGQPVARLQSNEGAYEAIAFSPDGSSLLGSAGWGVAVWDVATWELQNTVPPDGGALSGRWDTSWVAISPDTRLIVAAGQDNAVLIRDSQTGKITHTLPGHANFIKCVGFSGDGRLIASGDESGMAIVWEAANGQRRKHFVPRHGPITSVALNTDGTFLALGHADGAVVLENVQTDEQPRLIRAGGSVGSVAFSPNGRRLLVGSGLSGSGLREFEVESGKLVRVLDADSTWAHSPRYSLDGSMIACGYWESQIGLWDAATGLRRVELPLKKGPLWSIAASPDGKRLVAGGQDGTVVDFSLETAGQARKLPVSDLPRTLTFTGDPERLFIAGRRGSGARTVGFWNLQTGQRESSLQVAGDAWTLPGSIPSSDNSFIVSVDDKHAISVWDVSGRERLILRNHTASVEALAISPDCRLIASAGSDERVRLWDAHSGTELRTFLTPSTVGTSLAFSPSGEVLACRTSDPQLHLWETATGNKIDVLDSQAYQPLWRNAQTLAYNPAGTLLATCSDDGKIRIWDTASYQLKQTIAVGPPRGLINSLAFLPDGRHLATANENGTVSLLRLESP